MSTRPVPAGRDPTAAHNLWRPAKFRRADFPGAAATFNVLSQKAISLMPVRGIRGATNVEENSAPLILAATRELLQEILDRNGLTSFEEIVSAIFTTTADLNAAFPAEAARDLGMNQVPLLCASEIDVEKAMHRCIRVLLHVNTDKHQKDMVHVYLRDAKKLRPDVSSAQ